MCMYQEKCCWFQNNSMSFPLFSSILISSGSLSLLLLLVSFLSGLFNQQMNRNDQWSSVCCHLTLKAHSPIYTHIHKLVMQHLDLSVLGSCLEAHWALIVGLLLMTGPSTSLSGATLPFKNNSGFSVFRCFDASELIIYIYKHRKTHRRWCLPRRLTELIFRTERKRWPYWPERTASTSLCFWPGLISRWRHTSLPSYTTATSHDAPNHNTVGHRCWAKSFRCSNGCHIVFYDLWPSLLTYFPYPTTSPAPAHERHSMDAVLVSSFVITDCSPFLPLLLLIHPSSWQTDWTSSRQFDFQLQMLIYVKLPTFPVVRSWIWATDWQHLH